MWSEPFAIKIFPICKYYVPAKVSCTFTQTVPKIFLVLKPTLKVKYNLYRVLQKEANPKSKVKWVPRFVC